MENTDKIVYFRKPSGYLFRKYAVKRGENGLLNLYEVVNDKMVLDRVFHNYDHIFFQTMDDASLFLNAFIAASEKGYKELADVYRTLVISEANGNCFRRTGNNLPFTDLEKESVKFIKYLAISEDVVYL